MDKPLSSQEIDRLFFQGDRALNNSFNGVNPSNALSRNLHRENIAVAIDIFEQLLEVVEPGNHQYFNIQRNLVKAYQRYGLVEKAIALCQLMIESSNNAAILWGTKYMENLVGEEQVIEPLGDREVEAISAIDNAAYCFKTKTLAEFKQYCQSNLLDSLRELERKRISTLLSIIISKIVCIVFSWAFCQLIFNFLQINNSVLAFQFIILCLTVPFWLAFCRGCIHIYRLGFKRNIIEKIVGFLDDEGKLSYANNLFLEDKRQTILGFTRSQIFRDELHEPDNLEQEDCVYGSIGNTDLFFAEIVVENIKAGYLNEFGLAEYRGKSVLFRGLFFEARFPKSFVSRTFVLPNTVKSQLPALNNWRGEKVRLEDPEFERIFQVYSDNQIEARYLLSTNLMNRLVQFNQKAQRKVYFSFVDGFLYIAIPYSQNLFEPKLFKSMTAFTPLKEYFTNLQLAISIVNDLNLTRHIWKR